MYERQNDFVCLLGSNITDNLDLKQAAKKDLEDIEKCEQDIIAINMRIGSYETEKKKMLMEA